MDGFRRCLADEFSSIYCFNLRGNARTSGEQRRREKDNVFGQGTRTTIAILILIKNPLHKGVCQIYYHDIGDYLNRKQKLETIKEFGNVRKMDWRTISPNAHHDWINQRDESFLNYLPLVDKENKRNKGTVDSVFTLYSSGVKTNRDTWAYNFSKEGLAENMENTIAFYNSEIHRYQKAFEGNKTAEKPDVGDFVNYDSTKIHWADLTDRVEKNKIDYFNQENLRNGIYRPFCKQWLYFDTHWNTRRYQQPRIFPTSDTENRAICVSGIGASKEFSALMVDMTPDLEVVSKSQCFPRYRYTSGQTRGRQASLTLEETEYQRLDNIPAGSVSRFQSHYRNKEIDAGADVKDHFRVRKIRFGGSARKPDKSVIRYNDHVTIESIPLTAYDYVVNGKSALEWVMERYQTTTHKDSGITNDPNDWSDNPRYILNLLQKVVRVSMDTVKIVNSLPEMDPITDWTLKERKTDA